MALHQDIRSLRKISLLAGLPPWQLEVVAEALEPIMATKGSLIVERGSDDGYTYFLSDGEIQLEAEDGKSKRIEIDDELRKTPVANLRPRMFGVRALGRVRGLRIPDIVLTAAGCNGQLGDPSSITVENEEEDRRRQAETKLSFQLYDDLKNDVAVLPSLPDLALRIRKTIDDDISDAGAIARLVESDPAMAAKLLKVANSALYGGLGSIDTTSAAVVRLGMKITLQLVLSFALQEVFKSEDALIRGRMQELWRHSTNIAAFCFVLARRMRGIDPEEALLIGLVHDVGAIPILNYAQQYRELTDGADTLELTINRMRGELGAMILRDWRFPPVIVAGARDAENWKRSHNGKADFTDLLIVAQVHDRIHEHCLKGLPPLEEVSALRRVLGDDVSPEQSLEILHEARAEIDDMHGVLHG
jgi:HD-like signal output (HDOD) protein